MKLKVLILILCVLIHTNANWKELVNLNNLHSFLQTHTKDDGQTQKGITEAEAKKIITSEFSKLEESMKEQHKEIMTTLDNSTKDNLKMLNESVKNMTVVVDKMVYHMDKRLQRLTSQLELNIEQTEEMSYLILEEQLEKSKEELIQILQRIQELEKEMGPLSGECDQFYTCGECQTNKKCGWCSLEERCVLGDQDGPLYISCSFYNYNYCSGKECSQYFKCQQQSCLSDPSCGWCQDTDLMISGCIEQPADFRGCPAAGWYHIEGNLNICPKELDFNQNEQHEWVRPIEPQVPQKKKQKVKNQIDNEEYEREKQRVLEERKKQMEDSTPLEKRKQMKQKQDEYKELQKKTQLLKIRIKKQQARYDEISERIQIDLLEDEEDEELKDENQDEEQNKW